MIIQEKYLKKLRSLSIPYFLNSTLERVVGDSEIEFVDVKIDGKEKQMKLIAIFGCIGYVPNNYLAKILGLKAQSVLLYLFLCTLSQYLFEINVLIYYSCNYLALASLRYSNEARPR